MFVKFCKRFLIVFFILSLSTGIAKAENLNLNINEVVQEKNTWCWAATSKCISDYLGGNGLSQTEIVKSVKGSVVSEGASPTEQKNSLIKNGINTTYVNGTISYSTIKTMIIKLHSPILAHIAWTSGGAHAVVIYGYDSDEDNCIRYMDPWGDNSRWNYINIDYFSKNDAFRWVRTYYKNSTS